MRIEYIVVVSILTVIILIIFKLFSFKKDQNITSLFYSNGLVLIVTSFETYADKIINLMRDLNDIGRTSQQSSLTTNYVSLLSGFILVFIGYKYSKHLKERYYILNLHGQDRRKILQDKNIEDLKLTELKVREIEIDFVRTFGEGNSLEIEKCKYICEEIKEKADRFKSESTDHKKAFTGLAPIPFTVLAGTYLSGIDINEYLEYDRNEGNYYKLKDKHSFLKKNPPYQELEVKEILGSDNSNNEIIVAVSTTRKISDGDLVQFGNMNVIDISIAKPEDNSIRSMYQLKEYSRIVTEKLESVKDKFEHLEKIHLVMSTQSCLAFELGRRVSLNRNRQLPIIVYHYKALTVPKYTFGIIVSDENKGELIKG